MLAVLKSVAVTLNDGDNTGTRCHMSLTQTDIKTRSSQYFTSPAGGGNRPNNA